MGGNSDNVEDANGHQARRRPFTIRRWGFYKPWNQVRLFTTSVVILVNHVGNLLIFCWIQASHSSLHYGLQFIVWGCTYVLNFLIKLFSLQNIFSWTSPPRMEVFYSGRSRVPISWFLRREWTTCLGVWEMLLRTENKCVIAGIRNAKLL